MFIHLPLATLTIRKERQHLLFNTLADAVDVIIFVLFINMLDAVIIQRTIQHFDAGSFAYVLATYIKSNGMQLCMMMVMY